jgi:hypothetical protein
MTAIWGMWVVPPYADMMTLTAYQTDKAPKLPAVTASA